MPEQHRFKIRIRIVERREQIDIHCRNGFRLSSSTAVHKLPGIDRLQCQLRECLPATGDYWFKYALAPDPETVEQLAEQLNAAGVSTRIIEFGNTSGLIPGREPLHLLLAWPFNDPEQRHNVWREYRRLLPEQLPGDFSSPDDYLFIATTPAASSWRLQAGELQLSRSEPLRIEPLHTDDQVQVAGVRIGIDFHWDHTEELSYGGAVEVFVNHEGTLSLLNEIDLEEYLASVNSSEMTADCPLELLKAQTVAARSTLLATQGRHHWGEPFDLCSDDHCQCYQGTTRQQKSSVLAVQQTQGQVIAAADTVVDARYSKSCGGIVEAYRHVWEQRDPATLVSFPDGDAAVPFPADTEEKARLLIDGDFSSHCNTGHLQLPAALRYADDFFRWEVAYKNRELTNIINKSLGTFWERIDDLVPLERGDSGRIKRLRIVSGKEERVIGKELTIRRTLSSSHLFSALFYVIRPGDDFRLKGAGWGHGVGLCQLGAAAMALRGNDYREILRFYYPGSVLIQIHPVESGRKSSSSPPPAL